MFRVVGKPHLTPSELEPDSLGLPAVPLSKRTFFQHPLGRFSELTDLP